MISWVVIPGTRAGRCHQLVALVCVTFCSEKQKRRKEAVDEVVAVGKQNQYNFSFISTPPRLGDDVLDVAKYTMNVSARRRAHVCLDPLKISVVQIPVLTLPPLFKTPFTSLSLGLMKPQQLQLFSLRCGSSVLQIHPHTYQSLRL